MKNIKYMYSKLTLLTALLFVVTMSCERDISDEAEFATLSKTGEIFTDSPIGLGSDFYFPYLGSKATAWSLKPLNSKRTMSSQFSGTVWRIVCSMTHGSRRYCRRTSRG